MKTQCFRNGCLKSFEYRKIGKNLRCIKDGQG